jgi:multiple sugar transport system ATP-binding protein
MSIYENIRFPLKVRGVPKSEHDQRVRRAAELVELGDFLDRRPGKLSGGQRQRAALARAIVRDPQVFLMDEPLSNLDAKLRVQMRAQLKHLQHELQTTTIYVTHDQIEAMTLADRVAVMNAGRIQQLGTPDEVYNNPANMFVAGFIGSPPMNLIPGRLQGGDFVAENLRVPGIAQDPRDRGDSGGKGPSRDNVVLGIRSEDVSLAEGGGAHVQTTIYSLEPTGENTLVSCPVGDRLMVAKLDRDFRREINAAIALSFAPRRIFLFDQTSGERLETVENPPVEAAAV